MHLPSSIDGAWFLRQPVGAAAAGYSDQCFQGRSAIRGGRTIAGRRSAHPQGGEDGRPVFPPAVRSFSGHSGLVIGADRSQAPFRGFLPRKTTPRDLYQATVIAKPL